MILILFNIFMPFKESCKWTPVQEIYYPSLNCKFPMTRIGNIVAHGTFSCVWEHFVLSYTGSGGGATGIWWVEARDATKLPTAQDIPHHKGEVPMWMVPLLQNCGVAKPFLWVSIFQFSHLDTTVDNI